MQETQHSCQVVENRKAGPVYYRLVFDAPVLAGAAQPGQFVHIRVSEGLEPLFRRPFSIYRAQNGRVEIFYEPVGKGSRLLAQKKKGDQLNVLGPLGRPFTLPGKDVRQIVFIGGGIGVAPFMLFSDRVKTHKAGKILLYGGRSRAHTFAMTAFRRNGVRPLIATDDGSVGVRGRVSELFSQIEVSPATMIYACGPRPMMAAVAAFAKANNLRGEASMEEVMACGLGACLGCSIPTSRGYRTVCHDGPVFPLDELVF